MPALSLAIPIGTGAGSGLGQVMSSSGSTEGTLNWAFYDTDSNLVDQGSMPLSDNTNQWDSLGTELVAGQAGFVTFFLKGASGGQTYFDNFSVTSSSPLQELHHYYPYGREIGDLKWQNQDADAYGIHHNALPYGFASKRKMEWANLPFQDFGARMYDSQLGRWNAVDPLAEKEPGWSPYRYGYDNPVFYTDPTGMIEGGPDGPCGSCPNMGNFFNFENKVNTAVGFVKAIGSEAWNVISPVLALTDLNDATVLVTSLTRGEGAINIDGSHATATDKSFASAGAFVPFISGSAAKQLGKAIGAGLETVEKAVHGNSKLSNKITSLYKLSTNEGKYLKTGVTSEVKPESRYTKEFMSDKQMDIIDQGSRAEMLQKERNIVERDPGPLNKEPWAGKKKN